MLKRSLQGARRWWHSHWVSHFKPALVGHIDLFATGCHDLHRGDHGRGRWLGRNRNENLECHWRVFLTKWPSEGAFPLSAYVSFHLGTPLTETSISTRKLPLREQPWVVCQLQTGTTSSPAFTSRVAALTATAPQPADLLNKWSILYLSNIVVICPTIINSATAKKNQ